jgi:hypothetical protein
VQQTAEQVESMPPALELIADDRQSGGRVWRFTSQCSVLVVVPDGNPKDLLEVAAPNNEQPVQALGADRWDPALRVRVRPWCPQWRDQDLGVLVADHIVEGAGEPRVMVWEQGAQLSSSFLKHQQEVATLLRNPSTRASHWRRSLESSQARGLRRSAKLNRM